MIGGGIKFFDLSANLLINGATVAASSGNDSAPYILGLNRDTLWQSVGSSDASTESLIIQFPVPTLIDRLFLINHNFKNYTVQWDNTGWVNFTNVLGVTGARSGIVETAYALNTSYYEFTPVTTNSIKITVNTTQVANQDKFLNQLTCTSELGTLVGYPIISALNVNRSMKANQTISGKYVVEKSIETFGFDLQLKKYATSSMFAPDMDLLMSLHDKETPFNAWLCGGKYGVNNFKVTLRGFRLQDVYQVQVIKPLNNTYDNNIYTTQINGAFSFYEHI
jgi:hypothetical protein